MADNNKLELVVEVDVNKANASIKSINTGLSSMEQAAGKAARGASAGIDGLTVSMVKGSAAGNLLADSIRKALDWAKEWTIGAAEHAAHTDKMSMSMMALAKAHGVSAEASNRAVQAVKNVGFGTQDAIHAVDRLMVADMNLSKAQGLAKVAKDAAAIENITPGEALEKLLMAIESGASRGLRTMGIFVDLNKEVDRQEKLTGKTLGENEVLQLRYNAVMREAAKIQGAHAAATGSAEEQSAALAREVNELKEAVGEQFQGYLRSWVGHLRDLVGFLKDNSDWLVKFGEAAIFVAGAIVTYGIITKIAGIASAVQGLGLALVANPWALLLTGVVAAGAIVYTEYKDMQAGMERSFEDSRRKVIQQDLFKGKLKPDDVKKMGYTDDQVREIVSGKKLLPGESWDDFSGAGFPKVKILGKGELSDDEVNRIATERKKQGEAEKSAQELYLRAVEERKSAEHDQARARIEDSMKIIETTQSETQAAKESLNVVLLSLEEHAAGIAKIREEEKREVEQRSTYTDEKSGAVRHFQLNASTLETIHKATAEKLAAFDMKFNEEEARRLDQMLKAGAARSHRLFELMYVEPMRQTVYVWGQESEWQDKINDQGRTAGIAAVDQRKNLQLAQLDTVDARTLQDKVALENAKTAIEIQAMKDRTKIELEEIDVQTERQVDEAKKAAMAQGIFYEPYLDQIGNKIRELGQHEKDALQKATTTEIDVAQIKSATSTRKLVTDQYQSIFQSLKQQAGGVFDALVTKSQSVWSAIGNSLKNALLTAIEDVVTSRVAGVLMGILYGAPVSFSRGQPVFGGVGSLPRFGDGGVTNGPSIVGEAGPELVIPLDRLRNFGLGTSPSLLVGHYGPETDAAMYKAIMALYGVALPAGLSALGGPAGFSVGEGLMSLIVGGVAAATPDRHDDMMLGMIPVGGGGSRFQRMRAGEAIGDEELHILFGKTKADLVSVGRKGGLASGVARRLKIEAGAAPDDSMYTGPEIDRETTHQAAMAIDEQFSWLRDAFKKDAGSLARQEYSRMGGRMGGGDHRSAAVRAVRDMAAMRVRGSTSGSMMWAINPDTGGVRLSEYIPDGTKWSDDLFATHADWFEKIKFPVAGPDFDQIPRGYARIDRGKIHITDNGIEEVQEGLTSPPLTAEQYRALVERISNKFKLPSYDDGGTVAQTGIALVHRGESVVPGADTLRQAISLNTDANRNAALQMARMAAGIGMLLFGVPAFTGTASAAGGGGGFGGLVRVAEMVRGATGGVGGTVGGTPPFVPSSSGGGAGMGAAPAAGGILSKGGLLAGLKSSLGFGDDKWVDMGGGRMATGGWIGQYGSFGDKLQALGKSDAALMGGGMAAMDGLRRGGTTGNLETVGGGALIGYNQASALGMTGAGGAIFGAGAGLAAAGLQRGGKSGIAMDAAGGAVMGMQLGGPLGALIGGAIGAMAGVVRLFIKGATEKTKEKIKALYGVDISDKGVLKQIVDMTKSGFGGNIDMAIRSPQIRDLIQLYAMTTGQKTTGMPGTVTPLSLVETGGSLFQSPQYNNGTPLPALGGLPGLDQIGAGTASGGGLVIQLDGPATTALLQGQAVQAITNNPRLVQSATMAATKSNANRRELTSLQLSPGTIVS